MSRLAALFIAGLDELAAVDVFCGETGDAASTIVIGIRRRLRVVVVGVDITSELDNGGASTEIGLCWNNQGTKGSLTCKGQTFRGLARERWMVSLIFFNSSVTATLDGSSFVACSKSYISQLMSTLNW